MHKECCKCNVLQTVDNFSKDRSRIDGLRSTCRPCESEYRRNLYLKNPEPILEHNRKWYSKNSERTKSRRHTRYLSDTAVLSQKRASGARATGAFREYVDYGAVWDRDNWICQICSEPIDPALHSPDKMRKSIDHVIPFKHGGLHEYSNVQAAHLICNQRKSAALNFVWNEAE